MGYGHRSNHGSSARVGFAPSARQGRCLARCNGAQRRRPPGSILCKWKHTFVSLSCGRLLGPSSAPRNLSSAERQLPLFMEANTYLPTAEEELIGEHGEVFTRRWVVELILDLVGYTADRDLSGLTAAEPACGSGAFLVPMVERLQASATRHGFDVTTARDAILGFDLLQGNVARSRTAVQSALTAGGVNEHDAAALAAAWVQRRDFLLQPLPEATVDCVVGNPPYIRLEAVPPNRSDAYRRACATMSGRADVYVGFYEHGLLALRDDGALGLICADRWMRNAYGARLREMISAGWSVEAVVSMTGVDAFEDEVDAYPAITVLRRRRQQSGPLVVEGAAGFGENDAREIVDLSSEKHVEPTHRTTYRAARLHGWFEGRTGWPHGSPDQLALIADLEAQFAPLDDVATATTVGIGIATGADKVYIVEDAELVESERLLPLALSRDVTSGRVEWSGRYLVNPWNMHGLVSLADWPRLAEYLEHHKAVLSKRHTAQRGRWYKTIDRVIDGLIDTPKLYLPDFKDATFPVLDDGKTYPHHNLYWVTSARWDLRALGGLLLSDVANLFIEAYSVRMRGGFLRFQAQYLRRIRLPHPQDVSDSASRALAAAFDARDRVAATEIALPLYGLTTLPP
jgi:adenine-specific DNA-methyltransferase